MKHQSNWTNPWGLTPRETEVIKSMAEHGCNKLVGSELGIAKATVSELLRRAMERIGARTRIAAIVQWDRWARQQEPA